jgi:starvation-inducible DNA-binding protein
MNPLSATLKQLLANMFVSYFKAQSYHWNIEGRNFAQDHAYFGDVYEQFYGKIDAIAEQMRALGSYAPISLEDLYPSKTIQEDTVKPESFQAMVMNLLDCNAQITANLNKLFADADAANNQGLADFAAGLLDEFAKQAWMLRSHLKSGE